MYRPVFVSPCQFVDRPNRYFIICYSFYGNINFEGIDQIKYQANGIMEANLAVVPN
jgi:hypothetical protein